MCKENTKEKPAGTTPKEWVMVCYGNILRSQVLEQYLRFYSNQKGLNINFFSAGIAKWQEFPDTAELLEEIYHELDARGIPCVLHRNEWNENVEKAIKRADVIICADKNIKSAVSERLNNNVNPEKLHTFYSFISEGEKDFHDTYDYEKKRQDPIRFRNAFNELERIAVKMLDLK